MEKEKLILITGTAGFIGFHLAKLFLSNNWTVLGIDGMTDYYDVELKKHRHQILSKSKKFIKYEFCLEDFNKLVQVVKKYKPLIVIHLAAQAGVRYSLENPREYLNSNIVSTFNLRSLKTIKIKHFLISSTSSVYGNNDNQPFKEILATDHPISIYARQKNHVRFCVIPILTYLTFLLLFLGFLQYMALGDDLIWLCLNLPEKY